MKPTRLHRFSATEQLAIYRVFHQHPHNRFLHLIALPLVIYSGFVLLNLLTNNYALDIPWAGASLLPFNAGLLLLLGSVLAYAWLDKGTAIGVLCWTLPLLYWANWTITSTSWQQALAFSGVLQFLGWYMAVYVGHEKVEPPIQIDQQWESTNWYFKQHYYILRQAERSPTYLDAWLQYSIGPFEATLDVLFELGYRLDWKREIDQQCQYYKQRLANGQSLLEGGAIEQGE